jgi:hypothetical protein
MTVTGTLIDAKGALLKEVTLSFDPSEAPKCVDSLTLSKGLVKTNTDANGEFSINLEPGGYIVRWDYAGTASVLHITVPDTGITHDLCDLIDAQAAVLKKPFSGLPADYNISAATTYFLTNGDLNALVTQVIYQLVDGGFEIQSTTVEVVSSTTLTTVAGSNYINVSGAALTSVSLPNLATATNINIKNNANLELINLASLTNMSGALDCSGNPALNEVHLGQVATCPSINFSGCALPAAVVNEILAQLVASGWGATAGTVDLSGGTSEAPSGQGATDKATLIGQGATVNTN